MGLGQRRLQRLLDRDGAWCHYCGYETVGVPTGPHPAPAHATIDHIVPKALGGTNDLTNLMVAHSHCNSVRGVGAALTDRARAKHERFIQQMQMAKRRLKPGYAGPANHDQPIPTNLQHADSSRSYFSILGLEIDIRYARGRYWHVRLGTKTHSLTEAGFRQRNA